MPDLVELTYAALGDDDTQQAIVAVQIAQPLVLFIAVAAPSPRGWVRIAASDGARYDLGAGRLLADTPGRIWYARSELVLRASDGGSGLYVQDEAHFGVHKGELQMVLGFTSRYRECNGGVPMGLYCTVERRWFSTTEVVDDRGRRGSGGVLVEGRGRFAAKALAGSLGDVDDLENRYLSRFTCIGYWWNPDRFVYQRLKANPVECDKPAY